MIDGLHVAYSLSRSFSCIRNLKLVNILKVLVLYLHIMGNLYIYKSRNIRRLNSCVWNYRCKNCIFKQTLWEFIIHVKETIRKQLWTNSNKNKPRSPFVEKFWLVLQASSIVYECQMPCRFIVMRWRMYHKYRIKITIMLNLMCLY